MPPTKSLRILTVSVACAAGLMAQDAQHAWPAVSSPSSGAPYWPAIAAAPDPQDIAQGNTADLAQPPQTPYNDPPPPPAGNAGNYGIVPATLTLQPGTLVTVRINQWLSSDRNQSGDSFYATLTQPLIVDGVVVARRGATVMGRVTEVRKSHVDGTSRLGLQLTSLSLVDGQQFAIQSQVMDRNGTTVPAGRQAAAIGTTTAVGAGIGAVAAGGVGAAVGAGAGMIAGAAGVLFTRGRPTEVYPESMLSFRLDSSVVISTTQGAGAFHYASQEDYGYGPGNGPQPRMAQQMPPAPGVPAGPAPYPYYSPYPYYAPYYYSPYYYGPGVSLFVGPRFYGGFGGFRGFRR